MKKLLFVLLGVFLIASYTFAADPQVRPTITYVSKTHTTMLFTMTNAAFAKTDSLILIMSADAADSNGGAPGGQGEVEFETALSDTATGYEITGLCPFYTYRYMLRSDSTGGSTKAYSVYGAALTQTTLRMNIEDDWFSPVNLNEKGKIMYRHDSWRDTPLVYRSITLVGDSDADSTIWYNAAPYTGITGWAYGHADSVQVILRIYAGYPFADETSYWQTLQDTLSVTAPGSFDTGNLDISVNGWFFVKAVSTTDNKGTVDSDSTYFKMRLNRSE